jgi:hypothetical protein
MSDPSDTLLTNTIHLAINNGKISKAVKYYHLHRDEILERRRLKKLEDPAYKARMEERARMRAEKEAADATKRAEKEAAKIAALEAKRKALQEKREANRAAALAAKEEAKKNALQAKREAKRAAVLATYEAQIRSSGETPSI